ncbi:MAG: saccharopine dehydrogenase family protein [Acidimicrobiales bacterium]
MFGATGYTGRLVTATLVEQGARPVVAGRHRDALARLADDHGGLEVGVADAGEPRSVRALIEAGDVLVTTVGPFSLLGHAALDAAIDAGAHYVDSTGEAGFIRHVMGTAAARAEQRGSALLCAFGFDFVPGHLAAALAVEAAGVGVRELQIVYSGLGTGLSSGTRASARVLLADQTHKLEHGQVVERPTGRDVTTVELDGRRQHLLLAGGTEPLTATRQWPGTESVSVWLDLGPAAWLVKASWFALPALMAIPPVGARARRVGGTTGTGPSAEERARSTSTVTALARDATGRELARGRVTGPNPYDITATTMAAGALELATRGASRAGALGPLELFGHLDLRDAAARLGLRPG